MRNLYDLRGAIFAMACAASARRVADGSEPTVAAQIAGKPSRRCAAAYDKDDTDKYYTLNIEFHDMLMQAAANPKAKTIYDNLVKEMHLFRRRGLSIASNIARSIDEHDRILDAVTDGDADRARAAADAHIVSGLARYMKLLELDEGADG